MRLIPIFMGLLLLGVPAAHADDADAIAFAVFDYMTGWCAGDAARIERSLHPDLTTRTVRTDSRGHDVIENTSAMRLVQLTRSGPGAKTPRGTKELIILDLLDDAASVKTLMHGRVEYLHLARLDGRWLIVNILSERQDPD